MKLNHRRLLLSLELLQLHLHNFSLGDELWRSIVSEGRPAQLLVQLADGRKRFRQVGFHRLENILLLNLHLIEQLRNMLVCRPYSLFDRFSVET